MPYTVVGATPFRKSLTGKPGDPVNGRVVVVKRENTCLAVPFRPISGPALSGRPFAQL